MGFRKLKPRPGVVLQRSAFPDYRKEVLRLLSEMLHGSLSVLVGSESFDRTTHADLTSVDSVTQVDNYYLFGRRMLWQSGVVRPAVRAHCAIVELNPRIVSGWVILAARKILRRPSVTWGHVWSRDGPRSRTNGLRHAMRSLAATHVVYTARQRQELLKHIPTAQVIVAPNAVYRADQMDPSTSDQPTDILFSGRLIPSKKPLLLLEAFVLAIQRGLPPEYTLTFIGDGPVRESLVQAVRKSGTAAARVRLLGQMSPYHVHSYYRDALVSVSPGYVGLSAIQSFSFGVPLIVARDEPHAPEVEALRPDVNAVLVPSDDPSSLADVLLSVAEEHRLWIGRRSDIVARCREAYSVEAMAAGLKASIDATA